MQQGKQLYRCIDLFPEAILVMDTDGRILEVNQAARRQLADFMLNAGQTRLHDITSGPKEESRHFLRACARTRSFLPGSLTFANGRVTIAFHAEGARYAPRDGEQPPQVLLRLKPKQSAIAHFTALNEQIQSLYREIERRQRAERDLLEQREQLRVTLAGIGDGVIATDVDSVITFLNPAAVVQTGWSGAEAIGKPFDTVFRIIHEETRQPVESPVARVLREGQVATLSQQTLLIRRDGTEMPIDDSGAPIRSANNTIIGVVLVFRDISERRRFEQGMEAHTRELVEEHRRKDEFLAMLGHELRNPLAPIKAALDLQAFPRITEETRKRATDIMQRQVDHLTRLVDELLDVARISTGKIHLEEKLVEIASVIFRASELCEVMIKAKQQTLSIKAPGEEIYVRGDVQRLTQVVGNLLNNASKYTAAGGMIGVTFSRQGSRVEIVVEDNGMGISPAVLPRVFDAFAQSERALARSEGGIGVGLTVVKRLVEQHGGSVEEFSEGVEKGSRFQVLLPLAELPVTSTENQAGSTIRIPLIVTHKVLVVDDNPDAVMTLSELLRMRGHEVMIASNGREAVASAVQSPPSIVFLDIGLPEMNGYAVARFLREKRETAGAVLVALSGYGQTEDFRKSREAGFDYHLIKPADFTRIGQILDSLPLSRE